MDKSKPKLIAVYPITLPLSKGGSVSQEYQDKLKGLIEAEVERDIKASGAQLVAFVYEAPTEALPDLPERKKGRPALPEGKDSLTMKRARAVQVRQDYDMLKSTAEESPRKYNSARDVVRGIVKIKSLMRRGFSLPI